MTTLFFFQLIVNRRRILFPIILVLGGYITQERERERDIREMDMIQKSKTNKQTNN